MTRQQETRDQSQLKWIADFIWNIADDRLRDVYVRGKYRDVILPFTVLRRLDAVLDRYGGTSEDLARATAKIYFSSQPAVDEQPTEKGVHGEKDRQE